MRLINSAHLAVRERLIRSGSGLGQVTLTVRYGLIDRGRDGLCLVDTGYGPSITTGPRSRAMRLYNAVLRPQLFPENAPARVLAAMGAEPRDVRSIVLTHFHADHVANLCDFPYASIITDGATARVVLDMSAARALHHGIFKELLPPYLTSRVVALEQQPLRDTGTSLGQGFDVFGDGSTLAIPLPGHALGHFGIYRTGDTSTFYATDVAWTMRALLDDRTPDLSRAIVFADRDAGRRSAALVRRFHEQGGITTLCHDVEAS